MGKNTTEHINDVMKQEVANTENLPSAADVAKTLVLDSNMAYIDADAYIGNPYALLGNVIEIRKINGVCPPKLNSPGVVAEFSPYTIPGIVIDETSMINWWKKSLSRIIPRILIKIQKNS